MMKGYVKGEFKYLNMLKDFTSGRSLKGSEERAIKATNSSPTELLP